MTSDLPDNLAVRLYGRKIGSIRWRDNYSMFRFDSNYVETENRPVLGLRFEENMYREYSANMKLPTWFSNLLPEGALRQWIAAEQGVSVDREVHLLTRVGHDLPGAVTVVPDHNQHVEEDDAHVLVEDESGREERWRFSLAGVSLKFSMLEKSGQFACPASGQGGEWIVKLPDAQFDAVPVNEFATMHLANLAEITCPETRLLDRDEIERLPDAVWRRGEDTAYAIRRFDRVGGNRVHIEDLAQVKGLYAIDKYLGNYETVAALFYRGGDLQSLVEVVKRLTFFILVENGDAHLKNWSLIYQDIRSPSISPLYDAVSTELYRPSSQAPELGLRFAGTKKFDRVHLSHFEMLGHKLGCQVDLGDIARETIRRVVDGWPETRDLLAEHPSIRDALEYSIDRRSASLRGRV